MTAKAKDNLKLIITLRALYKYSMKEECISEICRTWDNILKVCEQHKLDADLVTMTDEEYNEYSIPVHEHIIQNPNS